MWHTLVYTTESGELERVHLNVRQKQITVQVRRDCLTVFCAYPLSELQPFGGFWYPGCGRQIELNQRQGQLAELLVDAYAFNTDAVQQLNGAYLKQLSDLSWCLDPVQLELDLLHGELDLERLMLFEKLDVVLQNIPAGYWVSERLNVPSFSFLWDSSVSLVLEGGLHRWWNAERNLCLTVYVDLERRSWTSALARGPTW